MPKLTLTADADVRIILTGIYWIGGDIGYSTQKALLDETYTPDFSNTISLDLSEIVHNALEFTLPDTGLFAQRGIVRNFMLSLVDIANNFSSLYNFTAIRTGIKRLNVNLNDFLSENFLTWQPQRKKVTAAHSEWITYYAKQTCYLYVTAEFNDHTVVAQKLNDLVGGKAYTADTSASRITSLFGKTPVRYNVYVATSDNAFSERLSNVQQYIVEAPMHNEQIFFFQNSLGGIDSIRCTGEVKHAPEYTPSTALMSDTEDTYHVEKKDLRTQTTGWLDESAAAWLHDFFMSKQRYKYEDNTLQPIVIDEVTAETSTTEYLIAFEFTYRPSVASEYLKLKRDFGKKACTWFEYINAWDIVYSVDWDRNTWVTSDTDVAYILAITDTWINLTKTYNLLAAFNAFPAITVEEWQKMTLGLRAERINAFKAYVNQLELVSVDSIQTNSVFRPSNVAPGDAIEKWLLSIGYWNDAGVWDDKKRWLAA
jgi:hypothetical protein